MSFLKRVGHCSYISKGDSGVWSGCIMDVLQGRYFQPVSHQKETTGQTQGFRKLLKEGSQHLNSAECFGIVKP